MKIKGSRIAPALSLMLLICFPVSAAVEGETPQADLPVLVTSCGQSPGPALLKVIFMKAKLQYEPKAYEINPLASAEDLIQAGEAGAPYKSVIIVMGASLKGMGAAGISIEDELDRIAGLIQEIRKQNITLIGAHIEGMKRRSQGASAGDNTDEQSIDAVAPNSDMLIIKREGDEDGRFTTISQNGNIPMVVVDKNLDLVDKVKAIFAK
jgi:uncharacterized protein DUF6305